MKDSRRSAVGRPKRKSTRGVGPLAERTANEAAFERFYESVTRDYIHDGVEADLPEAALQNASRNAMLSLTNGSATKLAERLTTRI